MIYLGYAFIAVCTVAVIVGVFVWGSIKQFELVHNMLIETIKEEAHSIIKKEISKQNLKYLRKNYRGVLK